MIFRLAHAEARQRARDAIASAPDGYVVSIKPPQRNTAQNALLHAELTEIAKAHKWAGQRLDVEDWKRLMTAAWMRATGGHPVIVPALDGTGFDVLYRRTSQLSTRECAELVDYVRAWRAEHS
jgi:hypothetical protein